jgi:plastocyanin
MTPTRTRVFLAVLLGAFGVVAVPSTSLATHEVMRAREVRPNVYKWRDSSGDAVSHIAVPHRVRWRNPSGGVPHNVRFYRTPSGVSISRFSLAPGETKSRRIPKAGVYKFYCSFHGNVQSGNCTGMCGRIRGH